MGNRRFEAFKQAGWSSLRTAVETGSFFELDEVKIKITDRCNLRCPKCNHWTLARKQSPDQTAPLSTDEWLDVARQVVDLGARKIKFSGGEPSLHPALAELVRFFSHHGLRCSMTTNGTLLASGLARDLVAAGMAHFRVSLDSPDADTHDRMVGLTGAFARVQAGIRAVNQAASSDGRLVKVTLNTLVTRLNVFRLEELIGQAAELKVRAVNLLRFHPSHLPESTVDDMSLGAQETNRYREDILPRLVAVGRSAGVEVLPTGYRERADGGLEDMHLERCDAVPCFDAWFRAAVFPAGDMYVCCHSRHPLLYFGNVRDQRLEDMLKGPRGEAVRRVCRAPGLKIPDCRNCDLNARDRLELAGELGYESNGPSAD